MKNNMWIIMKNEKPKHNQTIISYWDNISPNYENKVAVYKFDKNDIPEILTMWMPLPDELIEGKMGEK